MPVAAFFASLCRVILPALLCLLLPAMAGAGSLAINADLLTPEDVAVRGATLYVTDADGNAIRLYDWSGNQLAVVPFPRPAAIAVFADGRMVVASYKDLSVRILEPDGRFRLALGRGGGEFLLPRNIILDETEGLIYVVDQLDGSIKVYDQNGTMVNRIADCGNLPQDGALVDGELFVIDQPLGTDDHGGAIRTARVAVYDPVTGELLRSFGDYGAESGQLLRPRGIADLGDHTLAISDGFHGIVARYDTGGQLVAVVESGLAAPGGLAAADGRIVAASPVAATVHLLDFF